MNITFTPADVSRYYGIRLPELKQQGAQWRGACKIHGGTNPNFAVESATGRWFCHSTCGRGGDIINLEISLTGADFKEAKAEVFRLIGRVEPDHQRSSPQGVARKTTADDWRQVDRYPYTDQNATCCSRWFVF